MMQDLHLIDMESVGANTLNGGRQDLYSANAVFEKMEITGRYVITQFRLRLSLKYKLVKDGNGKKGTV